MSVRVYLTGDTHGEWFERFGSFMFEDGKELDKDDYLIVIGDFGIWSDSMYEHFRLDYVNKRPWTTLFIDGNHENFDLLNKFPSQEWHGGKIHVVRPSVFHLCRGEVFDLCGKRFFTFGGARSHDISDGILNPATDPNWDKKARRMQENGQHQFRVKGLSWWPEEMPSEDEYKHGLSTLQRAGNSVDYILTHDCPTADLQMLYDSGAQPNELNKYLSEIDAGTSYKRWYFGHHHTDMALPSGHIAMFKRIERIV